jgi:hypothetical protein
LSQAAAVAAATNNGCHNRRCCHLRLQGHSLRAAAASAAGTVNLCWQHPGWTQQQLLVDATNPLCDVITITIIVSSSSHSPAAIHQLLLLLLCCC